MATLSLEVDSDLLARAEEVSQLRGRDLRQELLAKVVEISNPHPSQQSDAVRRLIEMADAFPTYLEGGMPSREERNAR
jgi:hypothetical protein